MNRPQPCPIVPPLAIVESEIYARGLAAKLAAQLKRERDEAERRRRATDYALYLLGYTDPRQ